LRVSFVCSLMKLKKLFIQGTGSRRKTRAAQQGFKKRQKQTQSTKAKEIVRPLEHVEQTPVQAYNISIEIDDSETQEQE